MLPCLQEGEAYRNKDEVADRGDEHGYVDAERHADHDAENGGQDAGGSVDPPEPWGGEGVDGFDEAHAGGEGEAEEEAERHDDRDGDADADEQFVTGGALEDGGEEVVQQQEVEDEEGAPRGELAGVLSLIRSEVRLPSPEARMRLKRQTLSE